MIEAHGVVRRIALFVMALVALVTLLALTGCGASMGASSSARDASGWVEVASRHFTLRTDLPPAAAQGAAAELEAMYAALHDVAFRAVNDDTREELGVVLFAHEDEYAAVGPMPSVAFFTDALPNDLDPVPFLVMSKGVGPEARVIVQHELTHHFSRLRYGALPPWLGEGLAQYYSTLRVEGGQAILGAPLPNRGLTHSSRWLGDEVNGVKRLLVPVSAVPPVDVLVSLDGPSFYQWSQRGEAPTNEMKRAQGANYAGAFALIHLLQQDASLKPRFLQMLAAVAGGARTREAFRATFADMKPGELEGMFQRYLHRMSFEPYATPFTSRALEAPGQPRPLSAAEVHVLRARLVPWRGPKVNLATAELEAAVEADSTSSEVRYWRGLFLAKTGRPEEAEGELRAALDARADEPRYLLAMASIQGVLAKKAPSGARAQAIEALVARLIPRAKSAFELSYVAGHYGRIGKPEDGLSFAERAITTSPRCWQCLDTYAALLFRKGRFDDAVKAEERALAVFPESRSDQELSRKLEKYRAASAGGGAQLPQ